VDKTKRAKLKTHGWSVGTPAEFLGLSDQEAALVELRLALSTSLRRWRTQRGLSQTELARRLKSSQSRVAKMEAGDATVSVDLLMRSLIAMGATPKDLARAISSPPKAVAV
jgi:ribosome-binding protein aMBF1 (putative translation factor)